MDNSQQLLYCIIYNQVRPIVLTRMSVCVCVCVLVVLIRQVCVRLCMCNSNPLFNVRASDAEDSLSLSLSLQPGSDNWVWKATYSQLVLVMWLCSQRCCTRVRVRRVVSAEGAHRIISLCSTPQLLSQHIHTHPHHDTHTHIWQPAAFGSDSPLFVSFDLS